MAKPKLPNNTLLQQVGINQPNVFPPKLREEVYQQLKVLDLQDAIKRYTWVGLPSGITGEMVERMLYYKGQLALFYMEANDKFYILPYTLASDTDPLDVYGRFQNITPLPFNGQTEIKDAWIPGLKKKVIYELPEELDYETIINSAVLLKDYSPGINETIKPRAYIMDETIKAMSEAFPMARTSLIANSGITGIKVDSADEAKNVDTASMAKQEAALTGRPFVPIVGNIQMQELTSRGSALKSEEYLVYMQALDNYRLSLYGLKNGGLFQKKAHMLQSEQEMNNNNVLYAYQDGLDNRQRFCDLVYATFGIEINVLPNDLEQDTMMNQYDGNNEMAMEGGNNDDNE